MSKVDESGIDETEWAAQERGMRAAPAADAGGLDPAAGTYRIVAEALASMPRSHPPADFAADVLQRVVHSEAGLERPLSRVLLAVFLMVSAGVAVLYAGPAWLLLQQALDSDALGWVLAGMGCLALSWTGNRALGFPSPSNEPGHLA
jgi:hypothetical protein